MSVKEWVGTISWLRDILKYHLTLQSTDECVETCSPPFPVPGETFQYVASCGFAAYSLRGHSKQRGELLASHYQLPCFSHNCSSAPPGGLAHFRGSHGRLAVYACLEGEKAEKEKRMMTQC